MRIPAIIAPLAAACTLTCACVSVGRTVKPAPAESQAAAASQAGLTPMKDTCTPAALRAWTATRTNQYGVEIVPGADAAPGWYSATKPLIFAIPDWFPVDGRKHVACGRFGRFELYNGPGQEFDWNVDIIPGQASAYLLTESLSLLRARNAMLTCPDEKQKKTLCIEAEVTPPAEFRLRQPLGDPSELRRDTVCVFGLWVTEAVHGSRPEIHPVQLLWQTDGPLHLTDITAIDDQSARFDDLDQFDFGYSDEPPEGFHPWSGRGVNATVRVAVRADAGASTTFYLSQIDPGPQKPKAVALVRRQFDDGTAAQVVQASTMENGPVPTLDGFCRDTTQASWIGYVQLAGVGPAASPYQTFRIADTRPPESPGGIREVNAPPGPSVGGIRAARVFASESRLLADLDILATASIKPSQPAGQAGGPAGLSVSVNGKAHACVEIPQGPSDVRCRLQSVDAGSRLDVRVDDGMGSKQRFVIPAPRLAARIVAPSEQINQPGENFRVLLWCEGDHGESTVAGLLSANFRRCEERKTDCESWLSTAFAADWTVQVPGGTAGLPEVFETASDTNLLQRGAMRYPDSFALYYERHASLIVQVRGIKGVFADPWGTTARLTPGTGASDPTKAMEDQVNEALRKAGAIKDEFRMCLMALGHDQSSRDRDEDAPYRHARTLLTRAMQIVQEDDFLGIGRKEIAVLATRLVAEPGPCVRAK